MINYKVKSKYFTIHSTDQLKIFGDEFTKTTKKYITINYKPKSFNVNNQSKKFLESKVQGISVFSGCGGLDIGAQMANCKVISSLDFDKDSIKTLESNKYFNHTDHILGDIREIKGKDFNNLLKKNKPEKLILLGGPPCQPFSKAGYWVTHKNILGAKDPRNMIGQYLRLISELKPDGFILENVESILHPKNIHVVHGLEESINKLGYHLLVYRSNAVDFGVPQKRKRVFFIASMKHMKFEPQKTHGTEKEISLNKNLQKHERVIDWIGKYNSPKYDENYDQIEGKYCEELKLVPPGKNYLSLTGKRGYPNPKFVAGKRYWSFLLKLHPLLPSWTIISRPGHWEGPFHWENRRLRNKELSAIQTFPGDYIYFGSRRSIQKQIGNAVPPLLGKAMVKNLIENL